MISPAFVSENNLSFFRSNSLKQRQTQIEKMSVFAVNASLGCVKLPELKQLQRAVMMGSTEYPW